MKTTIRVLTVLVLAGLLSSAYAGKVEVTVVDEKGVPVEGATVDVWYLDVRAEGDVKSSGVTDDQGHYTGNGNARQSIDVVVSKEGWYESELKRLSRKQDHDITVVMRKIGNPIPLYVRKVSLEFPAFDKWLGFDFEVGDWVAPQGRGKSRDILFKFRRDYMGSDYTERELAKIIPRVKELKKKRGEKWDPEEFKLRTAKWKSELRVGFPSDLEGLIEEKDGYLHYSKMKMPHLAPEEGYRSEEIEIKKKSYKSKEEDLKELRSYAKSGMPNLKPSGYYIRTRVVEVDGKVIKANYVKIPKYEDDLGGIVPLSVGASGTVNFTYYFNPTPNDRNLEYRAQSNLATEQKRSYDP